MERFINKIINGDCLEVLKDIPNNSIDLCIIDPPYNVNYNYNEYKDNLSSEEYYLWQLEILEEIERILKKDGSLIYLNYPEFNSKIYCALNEGFKLKPLDIWAWVYKTNLGGKYLRKGFRTWVFASKGNPKCNIKGEFENPADKRIKERISKGLKPKHIDWFNYNQVKNISKNKTKHTCQLPELMIEKIIKGLSNKGNIVLDCFMGSGTTAVASKKLGRNFIGIEISKEYCKIAEDRLNQTSREREITKWFEKQDKGVEV